MKDNDNRCVINHQDDPLIIAINIKNTKIAISTNVDKNESASYHVYFDQEERFCLKRITKNGVVADFVFLRIQRRNQG